MKRELGIARCGLACCLCSENDRCSGCNSGDCPDKDWCENRKCSIKKELKHCYNCDEVCRKGLLNKIKPYAFTLFAKRYGEKQLLDCLEANERNGIVYHRSGITGDYDAFNDAERLIAFIKTGESSMQEKILIEIKKLGIQEFEQLNSLNLLDGSYLNLEIELPNGMKARLLDNNKKYYANQIDIADSDKCYGVAADENFIIVYKYGCEGKDAELIMVKKYC